MLARPREALKLADDDIFTWNQVFGGLPASRRHLGGLPLTGDSHDALPELSLSRQEIRRMIRRVAVRWTPGAATPLWSTGRRPNAQLSSFCRWRTLSLLLSLLMANSTPSR